MARMRSMVPSVACSLMALFLAGCNGTPTEGEGQVPAGRTTDFSGCKSSLPTTADELALLGESCVIWTYNGESILQFTHTNAIFNCCPDSIGGAISIVGQTITVDEMEWLTHPCDCICPFDIDYEIVNLTPGEYTIVVDEPYINGDDEGIEFTVDLVTTPSGEFCVERETPLVLGSRQ
jgi:hypothetical protein